jgi:hypothetical protein
MTRLYKLDDTVLAIIEKMSSFWRDVRGARLAVVEVLLSSPAALLDPLLGPVPLPEPLPELELLPELEAVVSLGSEYRWYSPYSPTPTDLKANRMKNFHAW